MVVLGVGHVLESEADLHLCSLHGGNMWWPSCYQERSLQVATKKRLSVYRGTSLTRKHLPLGPYSRPVSS